MRDSAESGAKVLPLVPAADKMVGPGAEEVDIFSELVRSHIVCEGEITLEESDNTHDVFRDFLITGGYREYGLDRDAAWRAYLVFSEVANNSKKFNPLSETERGKGLAQRHVTLCYSPFNSGTMFLAFFDWRTVDEAALERLEDAYEERPRSEQEERVRLQAGKTPIEEIGKTAAALADLGNADTTGRHGRLRDRAALDAYLALMSLSGRGFALVRAQSDARGIEHVIGDDGSPECVVQWFVFQSRLLPETIGAGQPLAA